METILGNVLGQLVFKPVTSKSLYVHRGGHLSKVTAVACSTLVTVTEKNDQGIASLQHRFQ